MDLQNDVFSVFPLEWDSSFFDMNIGKVELFTSQTPQSWENVQECLKDYELVFLHNYNSDPQNAQLIGTTTTAFIADTNIRFSKDTTSYIDAYQYINISESMPHDQDILDMTEFEYSRFLTDPKLRERRGEQVYTEWLRNSFNKKNKFFGCFMDTSRSSSLLGYILFSFSSNSCEIELLSVSTSAFGQGIAQKLFRSAEQCAFERHIPVVTVGTQLTNMRAVNLYHKLGCKQIACHQIFHLWN